MHNALILLNAIGHIHDVYITDAHKTATENTNVRKKIILIAAIIAALFLLAGCAAYVWNWYVIYFSQKKQNPLSDEQIRYIQDNTMEYQVNQTYDEYTVELKSAISESHMTYVTFGITAPDHVDFTPFIGAGSQEYIFLKDILAWIPDNTCPLNLSYETINDFDGIKNTVNLVLKIKHGTSVGPDSTCKIKFTGIVQQGYNQAYEQKLESTKYAGQSDYMLDSEESARVHPQILLASGTWEFEIKLINNNDMVEILDEPISAKALVVRTGKEEFEIIDAVETITLDSISLDPLGVSVSFVQPESVDTFDCIYLNIDQFTTKEETDPSEEIYLKMKDGSRIDLFQEDGGKESVYLEPDCPVDLVNVEYLHLSDGIEIRVPQRGKNE